MTQEERTALYRLYGESGQLLYVGITRNPDARWGTHSMTKPWWAEVASRAVEWHPSRSVAQRAERIAIVAERPLYNVAGVSKAPAALPGDAVAAEPPTLNVPDIDYWTTADVAEYWGVTVQTIRTYRSRKRGELPEPDRIFGRSPAWKPATIINFQRPGQGARTDLHGKPPAPE